ncbi:DUF402 domain-containing protein [Leekyejoonella antrihumi]|uniref:DUF402 domain-containing protein n=1 Tax=Leekyejoonella antrihumi TaxID=1660198 RepID=A0A563DXG8_9MICO|nr:DUF402 domain-containing protein [Leekyejoonella antrihumi]TWP34374.1 DUF402 domain-containing protein [Leekyejoonella antrihumi]
MAPTSPDPSTLPSEIGAAVHVNFRKWDDAQHWQFDGVLLGSDQYGVWLGFPVGTHFARPGAAFDCDRAQVALFPWDHGYTPTIWDRDDARGDTGRVRIYTDISTVPVWHRDGDRWTVTMIDLDLDVVQRLGEDPFVDDEDEFAEHQVSYAYPREVITQAERDCRWVLSMVQEHTGPFDGTGERWLQRYLHRREA